MLEFYYECYKNNTHMSKNNKYFLCSFPTPAFEKDVVLGIECVMSWFYSNLFNLCISAQHT